MRFFYNLLTYVLLVPFLIYWVIRGFGNRAYFKGLGNRFGLGFPELEQSIWIHAVSVGEVQAAVPLVRALAERYPDRELLVTTVTPTGAERVRASFGDTVHHAYLPFEFPHAVNSFFRRTRPEAALIMETEI
ncbi:MAG: glycosyltransferase N-terminal domain-containing protein, partial [Woeseiaceae bacterium]